MRAGCPTTHHQTSNMARHGYLTKAVINKLKERWSLCLTFVSCVKIGHISLHCQCLCLMMWVVFLIGHTCMSSVFWLVFCPYIVCLSTLFWVRHMMNLFFQKCVMLKHFGLFMMSNALDKSYCIHLKKWLEFINFLMLRKLFL